jgi:ribose transport system substrate-binding protein
MTRTITRLCAAAAAMGLTLLAGCSSVEDQNAEASSPKTTSNAHVDPAAAAAQQAVEQASATASAFTAPGPELPDLASLKGKTVFFVPATYQVPVFQAVEGALEGALSKADIKVEVCDGKSNPSNMASCMQQAIDAKAGAIITGSIPEELVPVAFESARKAGVPVVNLMTAPAGPGDPTQVAYLTPDYFALQALSAQWVIADSNAAAKVLYVEITDTPATVLWAEQAALPTYEKSCPSCEVTVVKINTSQLDKLPSLVTSELTKNPDISYVQTEVDFVVQPTIEGLQAANATSVKISGMDGTLAALQLLKGGQFVNSEVGFNADALAWYAADQAMRMMSGQPASTNVTFPYQRMFTADNIGELDLSPEAEKTGEWYGPTDYQDGFLGLWGLSG